jgi:hypothetical protein
MIVLLLAFLGCSDHDTAQMSGTVTVDGAALESGFISFYPVEDEAGPSAGTAIKNGKYSIKGIAPGKKRVFIAAQSDIAPPSAEQPKGREAQVIGRRSKERVPSLPSLENAVGNNEIVELVRGTQTHDFHLSSKPPGTK